MRRSLAIKSVILSLLVLTAQSANAQTAAPSHRPAPTAAIVAKGHPVLPEAKVAQGKHQAAQADRPLTVYSHGDPTAEEQYVLELINRARANPPAEGNRLDTTRDAEITNEYTQWGTPTRAQVKSDFATYPVQPPLAFNAKLLNAARAHSQDMIDHNYQGHNSFDGTTFDQRIGSFGYQGGYIGENVFCYGVNPWDIHAMFQIDFGNPMLGHRQNIMNFSIDPYHEVGIGIIHGGTGSPNVGPEVTTEDYGTTSQTFILGVVYDDKNHNGFYDIGEGLAGVNIKASSGQYTAVTSASGGYAIPFSGSTSVTVTASGGALAVPVGHTVDFNGVNVKVDFNPDKSGLPAPVNLISHVSDTVNYDTTKLVWNKVAGATIYRFQIAHDPAFKRIMTSDSTKPDTLRAVTGLMEDSTYYWRVQAKNSKGWGDYSATGTFDVLYYGNRPALLTPAQGAILPLKDLTLTWRASTPNVISYWFQMATDTAMANIIYDDQNVFDTIEMITVDTLRDGKTYYWRVRPFNDAGFGPASAISSFKISTASVASDPAIAKSLRVYPNPANGETHIAFVLNKAQDVTLSIYDASGNKVKTLPFGTMPATMIDYVWDASHESAGTYFFELRTGDHVETGQIVVVR